MSFAGEKPDVFLVALLWAMHHDFGIRLIRRRNGSLEYGPSEHGSKRDGCLSVHRRSCKALVQVHHPRASINDEWRVAGFDFNTRSIAAVSTISVPGLAIDPRTPQNVTSKLMSTSRR